MSENQYPAQPVRQPRQKKSRKWLAPVLVIVALFAGVGIGNASAEPGTITKTVTKEVEVPGPVETKEVEVEVPVEVTPPVCAEALNLADEAFLITADMMEAIGNLDVATMEQLNLDLEEVSGPYVQAKTECRGY